MSSARMLDAAELAPGERSWNMDVESMDVATSTVGLLLLFPFT